MSKNKKCICSNCEDCRLFRTWIMANDKGEQRVEEKCGLFVLFDEISRIRGSIDGLQHGVNEARNMALDTRGKVSLFVQKLSDSVTKKINA